MPRLHFGDVSRVGIVEEVTALELDLLAPTPRIVVVYTHSIYKCYTGLRSHHELIATTSASASRCRTYTQQIFERKVLSVDIVEETQYCDFSLVVE